MSVMKVIALFVLIIVPIGLMILAFIFSLFTKNKLMNWLVSSFIFLGLYFAYLSDFEIPFYYLNPAYYKYQSECKKLPKPVVYNQDYWDILSNWSNLKPRPRSYIDDKGYSRAVYFSEKLNKEFSLDKEKRKENSVKTSWGWIDSVDWFYDGEHYATTVGYYYNGLVFRFGVEKISFGYEYLGCDNFFKHKFR